MPQRRWHLRPPGRRRPAAVGGPQYAGSPLPELHQLPRPHPRLQRGPELSAMRKLILTLAFPILLTAQDTVAPSVDETAGPARGVNHGNYNVIQQWESGYRYSLVGGDVGKYRSDVNFRNGIRLLNSSLSVNSRNGHGKYFDEI